MSDERDKMGETEEKFAKMGDVEAHKMGSAPDEKFAKMGEPDEKFESDDDDVEAHMLGGKNTPDKLA